MRKKALHYCALVVQAKKSTSVRDLLVYCPFTSVSMDLSNWNDSVLLKTNSVSLSEENLMNLLYPNRISWCPRAVCRDARMHFHFQKVSLFQTCRGFSVLSSVFHCVEFQAAAFFSVSLMLSSLKPKAFPIIIANLRENKVEEILAFCCTIF